MNRIATIALLALMLAVVLAQRDATGPTVTFYVEHEV